MKRKVVAALKAISVGKYQTTLYTKQGTTYNASALGGIVTIAMIITMASLIIPSLISLFQESHLNMDVTETKIDSYLRNEGWDIYPNTTSCTAKEGCKDFLIRDLDSTYDLDLTLAIFTDANCSDLTLLLNFVDFGDHNFPGYRNYANYSIPECIVKLSDLNMTANLEEEVMN